MYFLITDKWIYSWSKPTSFGAPCWCTQAPDTVHKTDLCQSPMMATCRPSTHGSLFLCFDSQLLPVSAAGGGCGVEDQADLLGVEAKRGRSLPLFNMLHLIGQALHHSHVLTLAQPDKSTGPLVVDHPVTAGGLWEISIAIIFNLYR